MLFLSSQYATGPVLKFNNSLAHTGKYVDAATQGRTIFIFKTHILHVILEVTLQALFIVLVIIMAVKCTYTEYSRQNHRVAEGQ